MSAVTQTNPFPKADQLVNALKQLSRADRVTLANMLLPIIKSEIAQPFDYVTAIHQIAPLQPQYKYPMTHFLLEAEKASQGQIESK